jgi:hypothetical protein
VPGGLQCFGTFNTAFEAGQIYDVAVHHIYGDEAVLNNPLIDYLDPATGDLLPEWKRRVPEEAKLAKERGVKKKKSKRNKHAIKRS